MTTMRTMQEVTHRLTAAVEVLERVQDKGREIQRLAHELSHEEDLLLATLGWRRSGREDQPGSEWGADVWHHAVVSCEPVKRSEALRRCEEVLSMLGAAVTSDCLRTE